MIRPLRNLPIRYKLLASFGVIILINALFGFFSLRIMRQLGELVNVTYDRALMAGTFAQAAKFDFAVFDAQTRAALTASDPQEFRSAVARSRKFFETLDEDLAVVSERALGNKSRELITELRPALSELELAQQALLEKKRANLRTPALEQEWELAVKGSNLYRRLTGLYDDAAELGYRFRLESEEKNKRTLRQALVILGVTTAAGLLLSLLVAYVLILPIFRLTRVCQTVSNGDYSVRATVEADDEIGKLAIAFNGMLATIQQKDESIAALLAALPFGLFYIDAEGRISRERSPATDQIFANFSAHLGVEDFFRYYGLAANTTADILASAFQRLLPFKSAVFLLPDTVSVEGRGTTKTVHLSYRPQFGPKKQLVRIIVVAEDVTEKNQAIAERQRLSERVDRISRVSSDLPGYRDFLVAAERLFAAIAPVIDRPRGSDSVARDLHSLKGLLGVFAYASCAHEIHELESALTEPASTEALTPSQRFARARTLFEEQTQDIVDLLRLSTDQKLLSLSAEKLHDLRQAIAREGTPELRRRAQQLDWVPLETAFAKFVSHVRTVLQKLPGKDADLRFVGTEELPLSQARQLDVALVHLLNNSLDHGIEPCEERLGVGKPATGTLSLAVRRPSEATLEYTLSDDGRGIDGERLLSIALAKGLVSSADAATLSEQQKLDLIFAPGLSTRSEVSDLSGRGVGMDAVRDFITSCGGEIRVRSERAQGTTFTITLPAGDPA